MRKLSKGLSFILQKYLKYVKINQYHLKRLDDDKGMIYQGKINAWGRNIYVKVPVVIQIINLQEKLLKN